MPTITMKQFFTALLTCALLTGCAAIDKSKKQITFDEAVLHYEKSIRWGDFVAARRFQHPDANFPQTTKNLDKIKVTLYRQLSSQPLADDNELMITVRIDYYHSDSLKIHTISDEQVWEYDPDGAAWHITTALPAF